MMKKRLLSAVISTAILIFLLSGCGKESIVSEENMQLVSSDEKMGDPSDYNIVMIVKQNDSWFEDMAMGINQLKRDTGLNVSVQVPVRGDADSQITLMEELIAWGADAICIVPNDSTALIPTIKKARDAGIVVVTHEAPGIAENVDLDVEAFDNEEFGCLFGESLARAMGGTGEYAGLVGGLGMDTHMAWYTSAVSYITENYPEMTCVTQEPLEDGNSAKGAHDRTLEILEEYPDVKGIFDCSLHGGGICDALQEQGKAKDVKVVSLALPSASASYLKNGSMQHGWAWRPADAGYATCYAAYLLVSGQGIETGTDLKIAGYENIKIEGNIAYGNAPLEFLGDNIDDYNF